MPAPRPTRSNVTELDLTSPGVVALLPMLYVAWSDGDLTAEELHSIRETLDACSWLDDASRQWVQRWLDPADPPTPRQLKVLRAAIERLGASASRRSRQSVAMLGAELGAAEARSSGAAFVGEEVAGQLETLERQLGLGTESLREVLPPQVEVSDGPAPPPAFDIDVLTTLLDGPYADVRRRLRALLASPEFARRDELSREQHRTQVLTWCRRLAAEGYGALGYPAEFGGADDLGRFIAAFETLAHHDGSLLVKFGVQFGLFGGSIYFLGTRQHHERYLRAAGTLELPGCFAMTELGHGSNVRDLETTATYDAAAGEFVLQTPSERARKEYIGNAARDGRLATVFAQLVCGGETYGVHAFLVPIRDAQGRAAPGVRIEDSGHKLGLNGVDNGRLWFGGVRVPRDALLDRFASVTPDGEYTSPITSDSKRFFTMIGTLVAGRVSVAGASIGAAKTGLAIAVPYTARRRQFGPAGAPERPLLDYVVMQRRLLPMVATAYALTFAQHDLVARFRQGPDDSRRDLECLAAAIKAYATWFAVEALQTCREACGGQGYIAVNRFAQLKADCDVFTTFEGDNTVLSQLVARGLLTEFRQQFGDLKAAALLRYAARRAARAVADLDPVTPRLTEERHLLGDGFARDALRYREERLLASLAGRLRRRISDGADAFDAFNACQDHALHLARAHAERVVLESFDRGIGEAPEPLRPVLRALRALFALSRVEADHAWFLESGYLAPPKAKAVRALVTRLCGELRPQALHLVRAFAVPDELLGPIGREPAEVPPAR